MKQAIRDLWAEALESGRYKQGYNQLRSMEDRFCAIGVLCDIAFRNNVIEAPEILTDMNGTNQGYRYAGSFSTLPAEIRQWAGHFSQTKVVAMNDENHNNFKTIAKWVRGL